jgi:hypothetical protein
LLGQLVTQIPDSESKYIPEEQEMQLVEFTEQVKQLVLHGKQKLFDE